MGSDSELTSSSSCSDLLTLRQRNRQGDLIKRHKCTYPDCTAAFNRPWKLERHKNSHTKDRPFKCGFQHCDKDYRSKAHLQRHISVSHSQHKTIPVWLPCPVSDCHKTFMNKWSLKKHMKTHVHKGSYVCTECSASFKKNKLLKNHLLAHAGTRPNVCNICLKSFVCEAKLIRHQKTHREYACEHEGCDTKCENWSALRKHFKLKHPKRIICDFCQKAFLNKNTLENHILSHLPDADRIVFKCTYKGCSRYYFYMRNLRQHIKTYHEENRYKCDVEGCDQTLASKKKLLEHKSHHVNPKPPKPPKVLDERKPRKDKGVRKRCMAAYLSGIVLPSQIDQSIILNNATCETLQVS